MATIASLLRDHVTLQVRSVDRLFLQGYVPRLMTEGMVVRFLLDRGYPIPSPALLGKIGRAYVAAIERFAAEQEIPVVRFRKGESKEETARPYFRRAERERPLRGRADRRRAGEGIGVARLARRRPGRPSALRVRPPGGVRQPLLLLHPRSRLGAGVHQDVRLRAVPGLGLPQRPRVGQAPGGQAGALLRGARQRLSLLPPTPRRWLRSALASRRATSRRFLRRWQARLPSPFTRRGPPPRLPLRSSPSASSSCPTRASSTARSRARLV